MDKIRTLILDPANELFVKCYSFAGRLILVILILFLGWFIAKFLQQIVVKILKMLKLDVGSEKLGIKSILVKGEIKYSLSELIGVVIYWIIMLGVLAGAVSYLGLTALSELLVKFVSYMPNVLASILVLVIGIFFATFLSSLVRTAASNAGIRQSKTLSNIVEIIILIFTAVIAIEQLKIDSGRVLVYAVNIILASMGLAFGLAFGLGCKDIAGGFISDLLKRIKKD